MLPRTLRFVRFLLVFLFATSAVLLAPVQSPVDVFTSVAEAKGRGAVHVRGYYRKDGTYVQPHYRSAPDGNFSNNWSTKGNVNPYTGEPGTKEAPPSGYGTDVYVRGYYRQDGTYVPPHYRSAPDGDPTNNWSTEGNVNPYTGEAGTRASRGYSIPNSGNYDQDLRVRQADNLRSLGLDVDWTKHSFVEMNDWELRIRQARNLAQFGVPVDWRQHSFLEMNDWELRSRQARNLAQLGVPVDWRQHSFLEMNDWELRMRQARELERLGVKVDWRQHSFLQLMTMEQAARSR